MVTDRSFLGVAVTSLAPVPFSSQHIKKMTLRFLKALKVRGADISIVFVKDDVMRRLNKQSLGHDFVTDIITFDLSDGRKGFLEGELVISPAKARRNARLCAEPYARELMRYIAHGLLHLKGFDDGTDVERLKMRRAEDVLLGKVFTAVAGPCAGHLIVKGRPQGAARAFEW